MKNRSENGNKICKIWMLLSKMQMKAPHPVVFISMFKHNRKLKFSGMQRNFYFSFNISFLNYAYRYA